MADAPAPSKRSRILDALEDPGTLISPTREPEPAPRTDEVMTDMVDSKAALEVIRRKILHASPAGANLFTTGNGGDKSARQKGLGVNEVGPSRAIASSSSMPSIGRRVPSDDDPMSSPITARGGLFNFNRVAYNDEKPPELIDMGGKDQPAKLAEFANNSFDNMNNGRSLTDALKALGLQSRKQVIPGLEVRLLDHQFVGVAWMIDQERLSPHQGGILADEMGLGKTIQVLATMAINTPTEEDDARTTLILLPAALLQQWKEEIETKTNGIFSVHIHHGKDKLKNKEAIKDYDVVLTTYQTLILDCSLDQNVDAEDELEWLYKHGGPLIRTRWYRVVLDEAQMIRNRTSRASRVAAMLRSRYRWAVTGTPIMNTLVDIYSLLRFGKFRPWNVWDDFNHFIGKMMAVDSVLAGARAQEVLKPLLLRRTKETKREDGKPLIQLPNREIELVMVDFSEEERQIYESVERQTRVEINRFIKRGTLLENTAIVLVMMLRLRQLCCHPYLILSQNEDAIQDPTLLVKNEASKELARAKRIMGAAWVNDVKAVFLKRARMQDLDFPDKADEQVPDASCPMCKDMFIRDGGRVLSCKHEMCFDCTLELSGMPLTVQGEINHTEKEEKEFEAAAAKGYRPCPTCKQLVDLTSKTVFKSCAFEPSEDELRNAKRRGKTQSKNIVSGAPIDLSSEEEAPTKQSRAGASGSRNQKKFGELPELSDSSDEEMPDLKSIIADAWPNKRLAGKKRVMDLDSDEDNEASRKSGKRAKVVEDNPEADLTMDDVSRALPKSNSEPSTETMATWSRGDSDLEASAKMAAMARLLRSWDATGDKTIIYSQWTSMLDLVESILMRHGVRHARYDGKMTREHRERALADFRAHSGPRVILISIKCGGVGLNLVTANRVINMDLSWNYATESQAYDRVYRIGQEKEVVVKRLVVRDTIEDRMLRLQDMKVGLAEAALGEGTGTKLHKLSVKEIKLLFGFTNLDKSKTNQRNSSP